MATGRIYPARPVTPVAEARALIAQHPLRLLEDLAPTPRVPDERHRRAVERTIANGFTLGGCNVSVIPPIDWNGGTRSFAFHVHALEPIADILLAYGAWKEQRYFDISLALTLDWLNRFQVPHLDATDVASIDRLLANNETMAWYDMGTGQRLQRLAYVLDVVARSPAYPDSLVELLLRSYFFHHLALSREHFFRRNNNHGFYQAISQLAAANRFRYLDGVDPYRQLAEERLDETIDIQFSKEGVQREHSPGYHFAVLTTLVGAVGSGVIDSAGTRRRILDCEEALTWMVTPDLKLALLGDTDPRFLDFGAPIAERWQNPGARWILSGGTIGSAPGFGVRAYTSDGYVFGRLPVEGSEPAYAKASYIAQTAAFHSRTHKHADDFSFIWYDRGQSVLIDPGRFAYLGKTEKGSALAKDGFWYSDPRRVYVESTRAHNTIEIDGRNHERVGVTPFGSALRHAGEQDGLFVSECSLDRFGKSVRHTRFLVMKPGHFALVVDHLESAKPHEYRQWFHFDPAWTVAPDSDGMQARLAEPDGDERTIFVRSFVAGPTFSRVMRGEEQPQLQGWMSDRENRLVPAPSFNLSYAGGGRWTFATLLTFGGEVKVTPIDGTNTPSINSMFDWADNRGQHRLALKRGSDGTPAVEFTTRSRPTKL